MISKLLFVCIGNVCRSPMAEGLFAKRLKKKGKFTIASAGLHALVDQPAVCEAQETMRNIGIGISHHRARQLSTEMILASDLILVMEKLQKREIEFLAPCVRGKVHLIGKWSGFEIPDPYNEPMQAFENCLQLLEQGWQDWQLRLT